VKESKGYYNNSFTKILISHNMQVNDIKAKTWVKISSETQNKKVHMKKSDI